MKLRLDRRLMLGVLAQLSWWVICFCIGQEGLLFCWVYGLLVLLWSRLLRGRFYIKQWKDLLFSRFDSFFLCWHLWLEWCYGSGWRFCFWLDFCGWRTRIMIYDFVGGDLRSTEFLEYARYRLPGFWCRHLWIWKSSRRPLWDSKDVQGPGALPSLYQSN